MRYITIALMLILMSMSIAYAGDNDANYNYCAGKYPTQHSLIEYCYDRQIQSGNKVVGYYDLYVAKHMKDGELDVDAVYDDAKATIVILCFGKYREPSYDTYNLPLVEYCIEREFKAYDRFHENTE